jgi:hypothetical protein
VLLQWECGDQDDGPVDGTSCVLDEVDAVVTADGSGGGVDGGSHRHATCAITVGKYHAVGDSEGCVRIIEPFSRTADGACAVPIATVGPVRYADGGAKATHPVTCGAITGNNATHELCVAMGRIVFVLR